MTVHQFASRTLLMVCAAAMPLAAMAEASSPTANDPQTGTSSTHHTTKHKKAGSAAMAASGGGVSNSSNPIGVGNGAPGNNSGADTAPVKGAGGGN